MESVFFFFFFLQTRIYLLLSKLDGELEPVQMHPLAVLERRPGRVVVQQHLQLVRTSRVIQQRGGEVLALSSELLESGRFANFFSHTNFLSAAGFKQNSKERTRGKGLLLPLSTRRTFLLLGGCSLDRKLRHPRRENLPLLSSNEFFASKKFLFEIRIRVDRWEKKLSNRCIESFSGMVRRLTVSVS